jgi:hypothetical protein
VKHTFAMFVLVCLSTLCVAACVGGGDPAAPTENAESATTDSNVGTAQQADNSCSVYCYGLLVSGTGAGSASTVCPEGKVCHCWCRTGGGIAGSADPTCACD